jgi:hypothetical protein
MEQLRASDKDGLLALITNRQVYFLRPGSATEDNIIFQVPYRGLKHCHTVKSSKYIYKELIVLFMSIIFLFQSFLMSSIIYVGRF